MDYHQLRHLTTIITLITLLCNPLKVYGYSQGAPTRACVTMVPGHGVPAQTGPADNYALQVEPINGGRDVSVSIVANTGHTFTGFMVQARHAANRQKLIDGVFNEDKHSQIRNCGTDRANTLTHRSGSPKTRISSVWSPPDSLTGDIVIRATIVGTKDTFWTDQDSRLVRFSNGRVATDKWLSSGGAEDVNNNDQNIENSVKENQESVDAGSGRTTRNLVLDYGVCQQKFCMGLGQPGKDCIRDKSCNVLLAGGYYNKDEGLLEYELSAIPKSGAHTSKYFSMAYSEDSLMGDDLVTDCYVTSDGKVKVGSSYNLGQSNEINDEFKNSLHSIQNYYSNGVVVCRWRSHRNRSLEGRHFDLKRNYHILLAMGDLADDKGTKQYHEWKLASHTPVNMAQVGAISVSDPLYLVRIHGSFMVIAWVGTVSLAIVFARYYKQTWVPSTLCGVKIWFAFHRGLMVTSVTLMIIAQICIFYYIGEYRIGWHQIFGSLAFTLALLNPIGALLRPHPDAPNRWLFNWGHWFLGNLGHIAAIVAIFLSTKLPLADLPRQFLWTVITFVVFNVVVHLILQFQTFCAQNRKTHDIAMQDMSGSHDDHNMGADTPGTGFRRFILGVYCAGLLALVVAMVSLISLPTDTLEMMAIT